jgi:hypothetical protein
VAPIRAERAGVVAPANETAHVVSAGRIEEPNDRQADFAIAAEGGKAFATLRARLALLGFTLQAAPLEQAAATVYIVGSWAQFRTLPDLAAVAAFIDQAGGRYV